MAFMSLSQLSQIKGPSISYLWFFPFSISNLNKRVMTNHLRWCVFKTFQGRKVSNSSKTSRYFIFQMAMRHSKQWETNKVANLIFREIDFSFKLLFSVILKIGTLLRTQTSKWVIIFVLFRNPSKIEFQGLSTF